MKKNKISIIIIALIVYSFTFINVNAQTIKDENLEVQINKIYIEIVKSEWDGEQNQEDVLVTKQIDNTLLKPSIQKLTNRKVSNNEIVAINLNLNMRDMLKESLPADAKTSFYIKYFGRLKMDYKVINKNDDFKSLYDIKLSYGIRDVKTIIDIMNSNKKEFNKIMTNTIYNAELITQDNNEIVFDEMGNDNCILLSYNKTENLQLTDKDILYYIYSDVSIEEEYEEPILSKSSLFIDVQTEEGKATIKGISVYSKNQTCEIYRAKSQSSDYEYVADIKCDGETEYTDVITPDFYNYKLKLKNLDIYSEEKYADLSEVYDDYDSSSEEECNSLFCFNWPWFTLPLLIMHTILPFYLIIFFVLLFLFVLIRIKNKKENKKDSKGIKILKYSFIALSIPLIFYIILVISLNS